MPNPKASGARKPSPAKPSPAKRRPELPEQAPVDVPSALSDATPTDALIPTIKQQVNRPSLSQRLDGDN